MRVCLVPGPGNGKEVMDGLTHMSGVKAILAHSVAELDDADLILTPRGPSRSFSAWYRNDPMGQEVLRRHQAGTPWLALCGSALPLASSFGKGCDGVRSVGLMAVEGTNDTLQGPRDTDQTSGRALRFHHTSAPVYRPLADTVEVLATTEGHGSILREGDLVVSSGIPMSHEGWAFLFEAAGLPVTGARAA